VSAIGTSEVDESANFSFSNLGATTVTGDLDMSNNNIGDVASINGGGNAVTLNDDIDLNSNNFSSISGTLFDLGGAVQLEANQGSQLELGGNVTNPRIGWFDSTDTRIGFMRFNEADANDIVVENGEPFEISVGGDRAINFDAVQNVTIPNGNLDLNVNSINNVNNIDKADSTGILQFADPTNGAILHLNKDTTVDVQPTTTQPGSSTNPSLGLGDSGAGFFINSSGEVVVVDEAGNTTTIS